MVTINGTQEQAAGMTILSYILHAGYNPEAVVVEKNLEIIPSDMWNEDILKEEDSVEILRFVGGG